MTVIEGFAPAKINLTLHVTGRRDDGYHELDSLVVFADIGDRISVRPNGTTMLTVDGPMAAGVPVDDSNLVVRAAAKMGVAAEIHLEKHLPNAAGLGGGSSDAAATFGALAELSGNPVPEDVLGLGADIPVCLYGDAARMRGVGEIVEPVTGLPVLHAVLVNPKLPVMTKEVFAGLDCADNLAMPETLPGFDDAGDFIEWLGTMRNDLEAPAIKAEPVIQQVFDTLSVTPGCHLTRMSGSGGTCFGLYSDAETAASAAGRLHEQQPGWWVEAVRLNA
ncbi:4-(cytidine 5'-diphospho)-2-C-methyl-D-erythritol kinase [Roseovarius sp. A21]|uniref:4-diphosphocytidyl-2-C-methyl-D-erythritol kinase n=1 Tax=Roseovarius bejariae TaxID=2576383 RepID=A0A844CL07_9RHOB|nr:4-(cytidine 5'-diphospho)-2-C-methyl-D-erythritol kinase [Roseovarius bejariae]MRU16011.1 4-(cytidine 5'-diphospho)-2-C-methyl-D-erythritol kinase [Roseovarius bejariae]